MADGVIGAHIWDKEGRIVASARAAQHTESISWKIIEDMTVGFSTDGARRVETTVALDAGEGRSIECVRLPLETRSDAGAPVSLDGAALCVVVDLTERTRIETALYKRLAFEKLIMRLSTHFVNLAPEEIDRGIDEALAAVGRFAEVDRAYVFAFSEDGTMMTNTHEWCAPGVEAQIENLKALPVEVFPWWTARLRDREAVHVPRVQDLPEEAAAERQILLEQSIQSVTLVPMTYGADVVGFVGFDWVRSTKEWAPDDVSLLRILGELLANALSRHRAEKHRAELEAQLVQTRSLENVARLAGGVAHDFNNLLAVVLNYSRLLRRELVDPRHIAFIDELHESARQAAELTRQLLMAGRRGVVEPIALDLNETISSLTNLIKRTLGEHVTIAFDLTSDVGIVRLGVPQAEQIVLNLTMNARDAMPNGGKFTIRTAMVLLEPAEVARYIDAKPGRYTLLSIADTGVGMTPEVASRAWDPFFTTKGELGTGLGLSTVHGIVKQAGGHVAIDTAPGQGCTVRIYLPVIDAAAAHARQPRPVLSPAPDGSGETVLVVEDSTAVRILVCNMLASHGYRVVSAADPSEAREKARAAPAAFDLLLTDVILPEISGRVLAESLRAEGRVRRVLYMSGYENSVVARQGIPEKGVRLLQKPFLEGDLLREVHSALHDEGAS